MNIAQRILKNFLSLSVAEIVTKLFGAVAVVYIARTIGPENFGKISFAFAIIGYFIIFSNLGLEMLGIREVARYREKIKDYTGNIVSLRLCLGILAFGLLLLFVLFLNKPLQVKYLIVLYGFMLLPSVLLLEWVFQGIERMEYVGASRVLGGLLYAGLVLLLIKSSKQLLLIPVLLILSNFIACSFLIFIFIKHFGKVRLKFDIPFWKSLIPQALPIGLSCAMSLIVYNFDTVMLGFMKSNEEVGYYNAAYKIILFLLGLVGTYFAAIFPIASYYYKTSFDLLRKLQSYTTKLMVTVAFPLAVGGTILARPIMNLIYGSKYDNGVIAFQILIWALFLIYINSSYSRGLFACDRQSRVFKVITTQAAIVVALNFLLIPPWGLRGAAIATVLGEISGFLMYYHELERIMKIPIRNYILKPLLASGIMGIFLQLYTSWNIFLLILGGTFVYFVSLYLTKGLSKEEIRIMRNMVSKGRK